MTLHSPQRPAASQAEFRQAMSAVAAPVHVVTTQGPGGQAGITATAFTALTDEPPMVMVCLNRNSYAASVVNANGQLAINCLSAAQAATAARFAGQGQLPMPERFSAEPEWTSRESGCPILPGAVAVFDCEVASVTELGTHYLYHCRVLSSHSEDGPGLLYHARRFGQSGALPG